MVFVKMMSDLPFNKWLRVKRGEKGLTQGAFGKMVGIDQSGISRLENGIGNLEVETVTAIGKALGDVDGALYAAKISAEGALPEIEREPDEEYLQESIMAYSGPNPILSAAAATARSMKELFDNAGPALTGKEPKEELVRGRGPRKGITKIDE